MLAASSQGADNSAKTLKGQAPVAPLLTVPGCLQWFVLLPWVSRQCRQLAGFISKRCIAR